MAACIVCLQEGRGASVCCPEPCPRKVHVACLAKLLDHGFFQCPNCFVEYDAWAVLRANLAEVARAALGLKHLVHVAREGLQLPLSLSGGQSLIAASYSTSRSTS